MHRHLRHSTCNLKAINLCWGCTWLITPYSPQELKGGCVVLQLGPLQNPQWERDPRGEHGGSTEPPHAQDASGTTSIDIHSLWQMTGHQQVLFADSQTVTWYAESRCYQVHLKMTHTILRKWAAYLQAFRKEYYPTNVHINPREERFKKPTIQFRK